MAKNETILDVLQLLANSGLDYTPKPNAKMTDAWYSVFSDINDAALTQAVHDYLKIETKWPAPAKLRELAEKIQRNHSASIFADPSRRRAGKTMYLEGEEVEVIEPMLGPGNIPGVYKVLESGWELWMPDANFVRDNQEYPMLNPPQHPVFQSWVAAQKWQENEIHARGEKCWHEKVTVEAECTA